MLRFLFCLPISDDDDDCSVNNVYCHLVKNYNFFSSKFKSWLCHNRMCTLCMQQFVFDPILSLAFLQKNAVFPSNISLIRIARLSPLPDNWFQNLIESFGKRLHIGNFGSRTNMSTVIVEVKSVKSFGKCTHLLSIDENVQLLLSSNGYNCCLPAEKHFFKVTQ